MNKHFPVYVAVSNLPQYQAAGPFTQLIYKNINVPVYTTLKGVSDTIFVTEGVQCFYF